MIYGASGATGRMVVAEAVRRGHRPLLAGRDAAERIAGAPPGALTPAQAFGPDFALAVEGTRRIDAPEEAS